MKFLSMSWKKKTKKLLPSKRKSIPLILALLFTGVQAFSQNVWVSRNTDISFYSSAPIEDIKAESHQAVSALNTATKALYFKVEIRSFQFPKSLMQEHFNEDYLESDKYPFAEFKGKIIGDVDLTKNGHYNVTVQGDLTIHNVTKNYTTPGTLDVEDGKIKAHAVFKVKLADHNIKIPRIVIKNIAEVVQVTVDAPYSPSSTTSN